MAGAKRFNGCKYLIAGITAALGVGCSQPVVGNWKTDNQLRGDPFYITNATFKKDGTFNAIARNTGLIQRLSGSYRQSPGKLILKPTGRSELVFAANLHLGGHELELSSNGQVLLMKREEESAQVPRLKITGPDGRTVLPRSAARKMSRS